MADSTLEAVAVAAQRLVDTSDAHDHHADACLSDPCTSCDVWAARTAEAHASLQARLAEHGAGWRVWDAGPHPDPERMHATVYERMAWQHDTGAHADSEHPYAYCPRCEMEHPEGAFAQAARILADLAVLDPKTCGTPKHCTLCGGPAGDLGTQHYPHCPWVRASQFGRRTRTRDMEETGG